MSTEARVPRLAPDEALKAGEALGVSEGLTRLSIFQVLLKHPKLAGPFNKLLMCLLFQGSLEVRLRELVIMRTGWVTGCTYEWTQHWSIAQMFGIDAGTLVSVRDWQGAPENTFSPAERAALGAVDDVQATGEISAATWERIADALPSEPDQVELAMLVATYAAISSFLRSLDIPLEGDVEPWPPDGAPPGEFAKNTGKGG